MRFDFRLLVPPDKASTTSGQNVLVACGIALRAPVKDLTSLAVAAWEITVVQNGEGTDIVPRARGWTSGLISEYMGQRSFVLPC